MARPFRQRSLVAAGTKRRRAGLRSRHVLPVRPPRRGPGAAGESPAPGRRRAGGHSGHRPVPGTGGSAGHPDAG
ncbi:hypothetical protein G6F51_014754 [Rhizopus arrhizus]|uniref:Uncharacterized protein n=1 Tax=Rhizopus oryzae TaxID=64495 RepID=A0A9P7BYI2_RHIOR|nr:hypothetical protein G6F51_014754 [Rhizopus arrhizus]